MRLYNRKENDIAPIGQADPFLIKASDGRYYMYATGCQLYSSDNLLDGWVYEGQCLEMPGQHEQWAPSVIEWDGKWFMYYSSEDIGNDDQHGQTMRVAEADSPKGPFRYVKDLIAPFSIDSHVVQNASGTYMFYSINNYEEGRVGTYIVCDKMLDPYTMEGNPVAIVRPTLDEEIFKKDRFKVGQHWHTIEGAFYFHVGETHFCMYSGAAYTNPTYFIGYSVAHGPEDADLRTLDWKKYPDENTYAPVLHSLDFIEGMGHNSVYCENGTYYIVYHGRNIGDIELKEDARSARIDVMKVEGDILSVVPTP